MTFSLPLRRSHRSEIGPSDNQPFGQLSDNQINIVLNWHQELLERVPVD